MAHQPESSQLENSIGPTVDHALCVEWYEQYGDNTLENRAKQERDVQYIHHKQWTKEDAERLRQRNQPIVTFNRIAPKINFIRGYETRTRVDPRARPRTPVHEDDALAATDALRFAADVSDFDFARSVLIEELLGWGAGGAVLGVDPFSRDITLTPVRGNRFFHDPHSVEPDFSDARFLGVVVWWDLRDATQDPRYSRRKQVLEEAMEERVGSSGWDPHEDKPSVWIDPVRKRVRIVEMYYQDYAHAKDADGAPLFDERGDPVMRREWFSCHFTKSGMLVDPKQVPWRTERGQTFCPMVVTSAFVDDECNRYGIVRGMIDAQDEINKRRSRALHEAIMRAYVYEEDAIEDPDEFAVQLAKADGKAKVNLDALKEKRFQLLDAQGDSQNQMALYQDAKNEINSVGPSMPNIAGDKTTLSGRAIIAKQNIGSMELETLFENMRRWQKQVFRRMWWMIRMLWTEEKYLRVRDSTRREGYRFVALNRNMTRADRFVELINEHSVPADSAIKQVGLHPVVAQRLFAEAQQSARQSLMVFQQRMKLLQQQAQQMGQPMQPPDPQQMQQQMEQNLIAVITQTPVMQERIRMHDMAALEIDIMIDVTPDTTIAAQEEFSELVNMTNQGIWAIPNLAVQKAIIENSSLRKKDVLIAAIDKKPDPSQVQFQQQQMQVQLQTAQAQLQKLQAEMQKIQAESARVAADVQTKAVEQQKLAAQVERTRAQTARDRAHVEVTVPALAEQYRAEAIKDITTANQQTENLGVSK